MTLFCRGHVTRQFLKVFACRDVSSVLSFLFFVFWVFFPFVSANRNPSFVFFVVALFSFVYFSPYICIEYVASGLSTRRCITHGAPPRDELVEWLSTRPNMEVRVPSLCLRALMLNSEGLTCIDAHAHAPYITFSPQICHDGTAAVFGTVESIWYMHITFFSRCLAPFFQYIRAP